MTLHTLNKHRSDLVHLCISALGPEDSLLLLEDGVYAALDGTHSPLDPATLPAGIKLYALTEDLAARGISEKISDVFTRITYRDFVSLSLACSKVVNWN
ncbi:MAG: sulfurtransferase complex subunit TusB [Bacteroidota bacterium]